MGSLRAGSLGHWDLGSLVKILVTGSCGRRQQSYPTRTVQKAIRDPEGRLPEAPPFLRTKRGSEAPPGSQPSVPSPHWATQPLLHQVHCAVRSWSMFALGLSILLPPGSEMTRATNSSLTSKSPYLIFLETLQRYSHLFLDMSADYLSSSPKSISSMSQ